MVLLLLLLLSGSLPSWLCPKCQAMQNNLKLSERVKPSQHNLAVISDTDKAWLRMWRHASSPTHAAAAAAAGPQTGSDGVVARSLAEERSEIYFQDQNQYFLHKQWIKRLHWASFFLFFGLGLFQTPPTKCLALTSTQIIEVCKFNFYSFQQIAL